MSNLTEIIKTIAAHAGKQEPLNWTTFSDGRVWAQDTPGGALGLVPELAGIDCCVASGALLKALRAMPGEPAFEHSGSVLTISSGSSRACLPTVSRSAAPKMVTPMVKAKWQPVPFLQDIDKVAWAISEDVTRTHLRGVYLDQHAIVATNGHTLAIVRAQDKIEQVPPSGVLFAPKVAAGLGEDVEIAFGKQAIFFSGDKGETFRFANVLDAVFPPYNRVIQDPKGSSTLVVDAEQFRGAIKRSKLTGSEGFVAQIDPSGIRIDVVGRTELTLFDLTDHVPAIRGGDGRAKSKDQVEIDLSIEYVSSALGAIGSGEVLIRYLGPLDPVSFEAGQYQAIVMPMRR